MTKPDGILVTSDGLVTDTAAKCRHVPIVMFGRTSVTPLDIFKSFTSFQIYKRLDP